MQPARFPRRQSGLPPLVKADEDERNGKQRQDKQHRNGPMGLQGEEKPPERRLHHSIEKGDFPVGHAPFVHQNLVQVPPVGEKEVLSIPPPDEEGRQNVGIEKAGAARENDEVENGPREDHDHAAVEKPDENATHISRKHLGPGEIEGQKPQARRRHGKGKLQEKEVAAFGDDEQGEKSESDDASHDQHSVDAVHEIEEIGRPDDVNGKENRKKQDNERTGAHPREGEKREEKDNDGHELDGQPKDRGEPEPVPVQADQSEDRRRKPQAWWKMEKESGKEERRQDSDASAGGHGLLVGASLPGNVHHAAAVPGETHHQEPSHGTQGDAQKIQGDFRHGLSKHRFQAVRGTEPRSEQLLTVIHHVPADLFHVRLWRNPAFPPPGLCQQVEPADQPRGDVQVRERSSSARFLEDPDHLVERIGFLITEIVHMKSPEPVPAGQDEPHPVGHVVPGQGGHPLFPRTVTDIETASGKQDSPLQVPRPDSVIAGSESEDQNILKDSPLDKGAESSFTLELADPVHAGGAAGVLFPQGSLRVPRAVHGNRRKVDEKTAGIEAARMERQPLRRPAVHPVRNVPVTPEQGNPLHPGTMEDGIGNDAPGKPLHGSLIKKIDTPPADL